MKITNLTRVAPCLAGLVVFPAQTALAQETLLEELVVTATAGQKTTALEAPATMTVIDAQEQTKYQVATDVADLVADAPGVNVSSQSNGSRGVRIRGLSNSYTQVLLNGRRSYTKEALWRGSDNALSLTPAIAIDSIEVIRGPMSTLYGADTIGGVVNVITRKHSGVAEGAVSVEGQYNQGDENGNGQVYGLYYSTPATDDLSYTVYGNYLDFSESFYDDQPRSTKRRAQENYNLVNQFDYALNDQNTLDLEVQLSEENQLGTSMFRGRSYEQERALQSYTLGYGYESSAVNVDAHVYYSDIDVEYDNPNSDITETDYGTDAQAVFFVGGHTVTVGAETRKAEVENTSFDGGSADRTSSAAFVETSLTLTDATKLTLGARYDHDSLFDDEYTYRGYLTHALNDTWSLKAGAGTAFKAPSMAQISPSYSAPGCAGRCVVVGNADLEAETGTFSEFGVYYSNGFTSANATVFHNKVDDLIKSGELPNAPPGMITVVNVDKATLQGLELSVRQQFERVDVDLSYTYMDAEDDAGDDLDGISRHEASLKANWLVSAVMDAFAKVKYRSKVRGELGDNDLVDAYATLDLGMRYSLLADLDVKLGANNITDRGISSPDTYSEVLQGRTYYAGLNYSF